MQFEPKREVAVPSRPGAGWAVGDARFLVSVGRQLKERELEDAGGRLESLAESWFLPANMLFKGSRKGSRDMLPRVARRMLKLADEEEGILIAVSNAVSKW